MLVPTLNYFSTYLPNKLRQLYHGTGFSLLSLKKFTAENFSQSCTMSFYLLATPQILAGQIFCAVEKQVITIGCKVGSSYLTCSFAHFVPRYAH